MKTDKELVYEILQPRVNRVLLSGFFDAVFDETKTRFFAFVYSEITKDAYEQIEYRLEKAGTASGYLNNEEAERRKDYITEDSWQFKPDKQCIEEGIYNSYGIRFRGIYFEGEWYIQTSLIYFGKSFTQEIAKNLLMFNNKIDAQWNAFDFVPYKPFVINGEESKNVELEEFEGMPRIVADIKQQRKLNLNKAYSHYINLEVFIPFVEAVKVKFPEEFEECIPLYIEDYTLIFPQHKKFVISVMMVANSKKEFRIKYFLYHSTQKKIYEWIYFKPKVYGHTFYYSIEITNELGKISEWNDYAFLNSSRTMDDKKFWEEYVFKKENDRYLYLKEIIAD